MLSVERVTKCYGNLTALEDISLDLAQGVYGLLAPNGAGKSTLMKMLATLLFPTKGRILWDGEEIVAMGERYRGVPEYDPFPGGRQDRDPVHTYRVGHRDDRGADHHAA